MEEEKKGKKKERRREERKEEGKGKAKQSKVSMMELAKDLEKKRRREEEGVRVCGPAAASASASAGESVLIRHWPASTPTFSLFPFFFPSSLLSSLSSLSSSLFHHFASPPLPPPPTAHCPLVHYSSVLLRLFPCRRLFRLQHPSSTAATMPSLAYTGLEAASLSWRRPRPRRRPSFSTPHITQSHLATV